MAIHATRPIDVNGIQESSSEQHQSQTGVGRGTVIAFPAVLLSVDSVPLLAFLLLPFAIAVCGRWNAARLRNLPPRYVRAA